jgi:hypothetical protein
MPTVASSVRSGPGLAPTLTLVGGLGASAYLYRTNPHEPGHVLPLCPFHMLTGWECPACGGTRMVYDLMHRHLALAWQDNALLLLLTPVLLLLLARWAVAGWRGAPYRLVLPRYGGWLVLAVAVAWTVLRNALSLSG